MPDHAPTIPAAVQAVARHDPDRPALVMLGDEVSYGELDRRSDQVAQLLLDSGVRPGDRVGLYAHKSLELFVAMHGIMRAGAAFVPINPDSPAAYLTEILNTCDIRHLFAGRTTARAVAAAIGATGVELCVGIDPIDGDRRYLGWDDVWSLPAENPRVDVAADDLAYIMFTSGSTGRPKGIMHTHRSGLAYGEAAAEVYGFMPSDRLANHAPLNFDLCLLELWGGLVAGATVVIIPEAHGRLPASFSELLQDEAVTVVNAVPYALVQLLHRGALPERDLSAVRWVAFGGEVFPTKDLRALMRLLPDAGFVNVYGPAEVNGVTYHIVPTISDDEIAPIAIGRLYPGMRGMVVDADDRSVADGEVGELLIDSPTRMVGYWHAPELTSGCTYRRTHDGREELWHRTGDLVYRDESGLFQLVGRKDRMVKTRGHRVELDEVESALNSHPGVEQAAVFAVPDGEGSNQIEAAVILRREIVGVPPDDAALKKHVAAILPRYAVPREVSVVADLPRTSSGKADRVALATQRIDMPANGDGDDQFARTEL